MQNYRGAPGIFNGTVPAPTDISLREKLMEIERRKQWSVRSRKGFLDNSAMRNPTNEAQQKSP